MIEPVKKGLTICFLCLLSFTLQAQIFVTNAPPYNDEIYLVQNVFLGTGVTASNITYYGDTNYIQMGFFEGNNSTIGLDSGIVLTSGHINTIPPGGTGNGSITTVPGVYPNGQGSGDPDLLTLANIAPTQLNLGFSVNQVNDASILEFDFEPSADTVEFRYVFASFEYLTYVNTQFNDVFGFFISGPGITGPYSSPAGFPNGSVNIAEIPGTTLPITVSTVHPGLNSQYYVPSDTTIAYTGGTTVIVAKHAVTPCQNYHIKLAIGDGTDKILDSGVFLEAKSFSSGAIQIDAVPSYSVLGGSDTNLYESCGSVKLTFRRFADLANPYTVHYNVGGTATMGVDYTAIPDSIVFPPGQDSACLVFQIADDGIVEGAETIQIDVIPDTISCWLQSTDPDTVVMVVNDRPQVSMSTLGDTISCVGPNAQLIGLGVTGVSPFHFVWATGDTTDTILVAPPSADTVIHVVMTDACTQDTVSDSASITIFNPPLSISVVDDTMDCVTDSVLIGPTVVSGSFIQNYVWFNGSTDSAIWVSPTSDSTYVFTISDACDSTVITDSITVRQFSPPLIVATVDDTLDCTETFTIIEPVIQSGTGPFTYLWSGGQSTSSIFVNPPSDSTYYVQIQDACNPDTVSDSITVIHFSPPLQILNTLDTFDCTDDSLLVGPNIISGTAPFTYTWAGGQIDSAIYIIPTADTTVVVTVEDQCDTNTVPDSISITFLQPLPLVANVEDVGLLCPGNPATLGAMISGGTMPYQVLWGTGDTTLTTTVNPLVDTTITLIVTDACGLDTAVTTGFVQVVQHPPLSVSVPDTQLNCPNDTVLLIPLISGGVDSAKTALWTWESQTSANDTLNTGVLTATTTYQVVITDFCGNQASDSVTVQVLPYTPLVLDISGPDTLCDGEIAQFTSTVSGGQLPLVYAWSGPGGTTGSGTSFSPILNGTNTISLAVTDNCGFTESAALLTSPIPCGISLPNVFTPNRDGVNDFFVINNLEEFPNSSFAVFNRWGQLIFQSDDYRNNWDGSTYTGRMLQDGVYFYELKLSNGETHVGHLTLLRRQD